MSIAARIAEIEKAVAAVPRVARSIGLALRSKLLGEAEQPPAAAAHRPETAKPDTAPAQEPNRADTGLPETYGRNRLVMLVVDSRQVHAYWEVTPEKLAEAHRAMDSPGPPPAVLRFHGAEASTSLPDSFDVPVHLPSRNWYVNLCSPGSSYYAELGLKGEAGQFIPLIKSNIVRTPRAWPVIQVEEHFMRVDPIQQRTEPVAPPAFVRPHRERPILSSDQPFAPSQIARAQSSAPTPPPAESHPPARINPEEVLKGRLTEVFANRRPSWERSQVRDRETSPAQDSSSNLTSSAEKRFVPGIFSRAPRKTVNQT